MSGRNAPRSKNGCSTCRRRKVKCGEERPVCRRCLSLQLDCEWLLPPQREKSLRILQPAQPRSTNPNLDDKSPLWDLSIMPICSEPAQVHELIGFPITQASILPSSDPLYPPLGSASLRCANSLILSEHDMTYFQYFPSSSIVQYFMKEWNWSSFRCLYQGPAAANKVIMRMILAISASDMHRDKLAVALPGHPTAEDHARYHYTLATKEFRQLLERPKGPITQAELEQVFVTMFLMVIYEWQFGHILHNLQLHLQGVRSLLESQPGLFQIKDVGNVFLPVDEEWATTESASIVSFIREQLLLWLLYTDISCRPVGLKDSSSLYDYVLESGNPALHPDHLYQCARLWGRCYWGEQYPDQEILDDVENYRGLELLHMGMNLFHKIWKLWQHPDSGVDYTADGLFREIMAIRDKYSDLFLTTKYAFSARRTLNTIYFAVCIFYAQVLLHRRLLYADRPRTALHRQTVLNILEILHKQFNADPRTLRRLHWPLLISVIETDDAEQRQWLRERLRELRDYHSEFARANQVADEILAKQDESGQYVNLSEFLRQYHVP